MLHSDSLALRVSDANKITNNHFTPLSYIDAARIAEAALDDARSLAQVSWVSFSEGVSDASRSRFTWATVKLYYSAFQALRARLLASNHVVFYRGSTPYSVSATSGGEIRKRSGNTHAAVFRIFRELYPNSSVLGQPISGVDALNWIETFRNIASYGSAPISDPDVPAEFKLFAAKPRAFMEKCMDTSSGAAFDESSALIALPLLLILLILELDGILTASAPDKEVHIGKFFVDILAVETLFIPSFSSKFNNFTFAT